MKKLLMICIAVATLQVSAQEKKSEYKKQRQETRTPFAPEEMAQLKAKKLTLQLALNEKQQREVTALYLDQAKTKKTKKDAYLASNTKEDKKTWTKEERFKFSNARLDDQIAIQRKMKTILSADQFEKWGKLNQRRTQQNKRYAMHNKGKSKKMHSERSKK